MSDLGVCANSTMWKSLYWDRWNRAIAEFPEELHDGTELCVRYLCAQGVW